MFDARLRPWIDPPLNRMGAMMARAGIGADAVTLVGAAVGLCAAAWMALGGAGWVAALLVLAGRLADGLDGAVARAGTRTDFGGYLDIFCDFLFYAAIPLSLVIRDPATNGLPGAFLIATFYVNAASFLGYAVLAEKRGMQTSAQGEKSLYYASGLLEGAETILLFLLICLFPALFPVAALVFGTLCLVTAVARVILARRIFGRPD